MLMMLKKLLASGVILNFKLHIRDLTITNKFIETLTKTKIKASITLATKLS